MYQFSLGLITLLALIRKSKGAPRTSENANVDLRESTQGKQRLKKQQNKQRAKRNKTNGINEISMQLNKTSS